MSSPTRAALVAGAALLGLGALASSPAGATTPVGARPPLHGAITFSRVDDAGAFQVWVANADLSRQRQLTSGRSNSQASTWKPDGTRLAFDSDRTDPDPDDGVGVNDIFTVRPDGSGLVQVTRSSGVSADPSWSPDGKLLTFESDLGDYPAKQGIYVARADGSAVRRVTTLPEGAWYDAAPRFSPDGKRLVFTRFRPDGAGNETSALNLVDADGSHETVLASTADLNPGDAAWSPDGRTIVFEAYGPVLNHGDVYTVGADGRHLRNLTRNDPLKGGAADPVFSPDGRLIMHLKAVLSDGVFQRAGLATMASNGRGDAFVTAEQTSGEEHQPDWIARARSVRLPSAEVRAVRPSVGKVHPPERPGRDELRSEALARQSMP
ncbi:MAG TPA: hypothetical protein VNR17_15945 [Luteimicrobium sp.]|nr:hypothetical protein [Luteimicrobium sp.]